MQVKSMFSFDITGGKEAVKVSMHLCLYSSTLHHYLLSHSRNQVSSSRLSVAVLQAAVPSALLYHE